ncbi:MAG TPA: hypothetical protein VFO00_02870 [Vitreimonas sp.]|nr:hypothetical protein [Vitreimonas sp.]
MKHRVIVTLAALAALAGCSHSIDSAHEPSFGASVAAMHEAQAVPAAATPGAPEGSGAVGSLAQQRYKGGQTRPLVPASTSTLNPSN